jgi:hypothetical protein
MPNALYTERRAQAKRLSPPPFPADLDSAEIRVKGSPLWYALQAANPLLDLCK